MMRKPNLFLIGAMRSGTTSMYHYLKEHPEIFMSPIKEPNYFVWDDESIDEINAWFTIRDFEAYMSLFADAKKEKIIGEASHSYLYSPIAPRRIFEFNPKGHILVILRNPVERAYSHYLFLRRLGREPVDNFKKALDLEAERIRTKQGFGHYIRRGFYYQQLIRWYSLFHKEQIRVCLYEDLRNDSLNLMRNIYEFLGVNTTFRPNLSLKSHPSGKIKIKWLYFIYVHCQKYSKQIKKLPGPISQTARRIGQALLTTAIEKEAMNESVRHRLIALYKEDILRLQELIGRDLSHWLRV